MIPYPSCSLTGYNNVAALIAGRGNKTTSGGYYYVLAGPEWDEVFVKCKSALAVARTPRCTSTLLPARPRAYTELGASRRGPYTHTP